ncbi:hypothetical protein [Levilactobacillus huananensis]|uniref:hypothetical protein n=1 Tax=Levilactobacillus huananensis TaxID=2486019 RepID=UPI000F7A725D|nr:hypothetical protein [Levilactobacillus huananensis]
MAKKTIKGEDGKIYVVKEQTGVKWYGHWYIWLGITIVIIVIGGVGFAVHQQRLQSQDQGTEAVLESSSSEDSNSSGTDSDSESDTNDSTSDDSDVQLSDGTDVSIKKRQTFKSNYGDTSFNNSDLEVTGVNVATTDIFSYDDDDNGNTSEEGFIAVSLSFTAGADMTLFDGQSVLNTSDGQQINIASMESQKIDDINSGATKKAVLVFFVPHLNKTNQFSSIRLKMDADTGDSGTLHTYDITIPLKSSK